MSWFEIIITVVIVWGGSSIANSLRQMAKDVEHIKEILVRKEMQRTDPRG